MFQTKMALVSLIIVNTVVLQRKIKRRASDGDRASVTRTIKIIGFVSLLVWVAIIFAGRWIAYVNSNP
jgi:hypothetical protein